MKTRNLTLGTHVIFLALALFIILSSSASAALSPEARAEVCHSSGGLFFDDVCRCPPFISSSLWDVCWLTNPETMCTRLDGTVSYQPIVGPAGAGFICTRSNQSITTQAIDFSSKYSIIYSVIILGVIIFLCHALYQAIKSRRKK